MPYAEGRIFNDADSHFVETQDWIFQYADPKVRPKLAPMDFEACGGKATEELVSALPSMIQRRKKDPAAMARAEANVLERKSWHALGGYDPGERSRALDLLGYSRQLVFTGNRGTGKTKIARILGRIFADLGVLSSGHLIEVDRADLVGEYTSESGPKVRRAVERAAGGVLVIDEAHMLNAAESPRDREAIDVLLAAVQDYPEDLVVVLSGPDGEINGLLKREQELAALFPRVVRFADLAEDELVEVFAGKAADAGFALHDGVQAKVRALVHAAPRGGAFANARLMVNLLDRAVAMQGRRVLEDGIVDETESLDGPDRAAR